MSVYESAFKRTSKGKTTGHVSRILSAVNILLYIYIAIILIKAHQYLIVGALFILSFTPIAPLAMIGAAVYFFVINQWYLVFLFILSGLIGFISVRIGIRFNKRIIQNQAALVDPFENMPDIVIWYSALYISFALALLTSKIISVVFWIFFVIVLIFLSIRFSTRLRNKRSQLHYPLSIRYSEFLGSEVAHSKFYSDEFEVEKPLNELIKSVYPSFSQEDVSKMIEDAKQKLENFTDRPSLERYFKNNYEKLNQNKIDNIMNEVELKFQSKESKSIIAQYVIAEIIAREFGEIERIKYLADIITGEITTI